MFSRLHNDDKTGEFNQIQLYSTRLVQKQDYAIERELARAVNLIQILQFWLVNFFFWFSKYGLVLSGTLY